MTEDQAETGTSGAEGAREATADSESPIPPAAAPPAVEKRAEGGGLLRRAVPPATIVLLALTLRVLFVHQVNTSPVPDLSRVEDLADDGSGFRRQVRDDGTDMEKHDYIARWILANGWFEKSADVSPLYAYAFLPLAYLATGSSPFATALIQAVFDSATVLLVYLLALRLYDRRSAAYAALMAAVYAPFIIYQRQLLGESLLGFLVALFFTLVVWWDGRLTARRAIVAGAVFGLAMLAKPTAVVFAPLTVFLMWKRAAWRLRAVAVPALAAAAAALVVILPFSLRNWKGSGEFHLVRGNSGKMLYMGNNPVATGAYGEPRGEEAERLAAETKDMPLSRKDRVYTNAALAFARDNPRHFLRLLWRKVTLFFGANEVPNNLSISLFRQVTFLQHPVFIGFGFALPLAATGLLFSIRRPGAWFLGAQAAVYSAAIIAIVVVGRYRLAIVPLLLPAAGFALSELIFTLKNLELGKTLALLGVAAVVALPVNWRSLSVLAAQKLHPGGFKSRHGEVLLVRDDSDFSTPYSATLSGEGEVRKILHAGKTPADLETAVVAIRLSVGSPGVLTVTLNDVPARVRVTESSRGWLKVAFPPEAVIEGFNAIDVKGDGSVEAFIYADDAYGFRRSFYNPDGRRWRAGWLDVTTYRRHPPFHIGGQELKIRLELISAPPAAG